MGLSLPAVAAQRTARQTGATTAATARTRAPRASRATDPLKAPAHVKAVKSLLTFHTDGVLGGYDAGDGSGNVELGAAMAEIIPAGGATMRETRALQYEDHGRINLSQRVAVSGVAKDGILRGTLIGTVSAHDLDHLSWPQYAKAIKQRIDADRIQVSYDHGKGTRQVVLAKGLKSGPATAVPFAIPVGTTGMTRLIYDRTDARGNIVGASDAYGGRIIEISRGQ